MINNEKEKTASLEKRYDNGTSARRLQPTKKRLPLIKICAALILSLGCAAEASAQSLPQKACRFHPGHYLALPGEDRPTTDMEKALKPDTPFKGVHKIYSWNALEPSPGHYDFSLIKADLASLRRRNKRLIVQVWTKTFHPERGPNHPTFLKGSPKPGGGYYSAVFRPERTGGYSLAFWDPAVAFQCRNLYKAIGKELSCDPNVSALEAVNLDETAWGNLKADEQALQDAGTMPYNREKFGQNMMLMFKGLNDSLPHTVAIQFINWPQDLVPYFVQQVFSMGGGIGGPDLHPDLNIPTYAHLPSLAGMVPLGFAVQWPDTYTPPRTGRPHNRADVIRTLRFAQQLKLNYVFWIQRSGYIEIVEEVLKDPSVVKQSDPAGGLVARYPLSVLPINSTVVNGPKPFPPGL